MSLIDKDYKPEEWSDESVVAALSSSTRLPENVLKDHRPTIDDVFDEKKKREENLSKHGIGSG